MPADLGPHVVGQRVVVRRLVRGETGPSGGPAMTDVLGVCESWADGEVTVRRERGDLVRIATADIVSGKPVPRRPSRHTRLSREDADRMVLPGWPAVETEPLGDWLLRASGGFSSRGNSVLAVGDPGVPVDEAVELVVGWYAARGLPARVQVYPGEDLAGVLDHAGWAAYDRTTLMVAAVSAVLRRSPLERGGDRVRHDDRLDAGWLATDARAARFGEPARAVLETGEVGFATVRDGGRVLARGRGAVHGDLLGISSLWTDPDRRGQGLGGEVLRSLLEWGAERGAATAYLQVVSDNEAALALYRSRGFEDHHEYEYRVRPAGAGSTTSRP